MDYIDFTGQVGFPSAVESSGERGVTTHFPPPTSSMADPSKAAFFNSGLPHQMPCDIKPRLTKEQHDILEAHYQKQPKPNTNTKKSFAETLGVSLDKVNVSMPGSCRSDAWLRHCNRTGSRTAVRRRNRMPKNGRTRSICSMRTTRASSISAPTPTPPLPSPRKNTTP